MDNNQRYERYQRQMLLKEIGQVGQKKLSEAKVLVIGAGGLGCPALQYLAAAGVGTIGIVDDDVVSLSNLHRQILYKTSDVGLPKAERAAEVLNHLNPDIHIIPYNLRITNQNALELIAQYNIVLDGSDNFSTRYMINDACALLKKPLVYGAISRFEGQVAIFNCKKENEPPVNYRDLFPNPPNDNEVLNCSEAGVLGVLPGIIGSMQANETIKLITGIGQPLINEILTYNALNNKTYQIDLSHSVESEKNIPLNEEGFRNTDYDWTCSIDSFVEIDVTTFDALRHVDEVTIIDVREPGEEPLIDQFGHLKIPLGEFASAAKDIKGDTLIAFCQSGKRSMQAAKILLDTFGTSKKIYSLKGGITSWIKQSRSNNYVR